MSFFRALRAFFLFALAFVRRCFACLSRCFAFSLVFFPVFAVHQVLRSAGPWSLGTSTEASICHAWAQAIDSSQHCLYIEQQ